MERSKTLNTKEFSFNCGLTDGQAAKDVSPMCHMRGIKLALDGKHFDKNYQAGVQKAFWG